MSCYVYHYESSIERESSDGREGHIEQLGGNGQEQKAQRKTQKDVNFILFKTAKNPLSTFEKKNTCLSLHYILHL